MSNSTNSTSGELAGAKTQSTATFVTALWLNAAVFGVELIAFTLLRPKFPLIYEPRTLILNDKKRSDPLISGRSIKKLFEWPIALYNKDHTDILRTNGMDAYFFVRFLRMFVIMMVPIWLLSWIVLLPINAVNEHNGRTGLDRFTFGNISPANGDRYAAHIILVYLFTYWIFYNIRKEMHNFVDKRMHYLISEEHSRTAQANTILVTGIPSRYLYEQRLRNLFSYLPGGVRKVWLNRDLKDLPKWYEKRLKLCNKLESAETSLISTAMKLHRKSEKARAKAEKKGLPTASDSKDGLAPEVSNQDPEKAVGRRTDKFVPDAKRPKRREALSFLPFSLPLIGKKVDTIDTLRADINELTKMLDDGRNLLRQEIDETVTSRAKLDGILHAASHEHNDGLIDVIEQNNGVGKSENGEKGKEKEHVSKGKKQEYPPLNSAFILFNQQIAAHMAAQVLTHHAPYRMAERYIEVAPADVIWGNLGLDPYEKKIRLAISYGITAGLVILWAFPVAFVGAVSNVSNLCTTYHWLAWLCTLPKTVIGILQGVLPPVLLAVLMMLLPIFLRYLAKFEGIPRHTGVELSLMTRYFIFQVVHSFLIVTLSSGIIAALPALVKNPASVPSLLATNLPQASNFFLTYVVLQGLSGTASGFLNAVPLVIYYVKLFILGSTPRSVYNIRNNLNNVQWGTLFPTITLLSVISLTYSVISPIINGLSVLSFLLFYEMYKYLFLYELDQPQWGDTGGLFFPKAVQHIFVGLYIQQICLAALFFLARDENHHPNALPEGIIMIVLIALTASFHMVINNSYGPLLNSLPLSLAHRSYGMKKTEENSQGTFEEEEQGFGGDRDTTTTARKRASAGKDNGDDDEDEIIFEEKVRDKPLPPGPLPIQDEKKRGKSVAVEGKHNDEPTDFYHPAGVEPQRIIWIPRDPLGVADLEVESNEASEIVSTCKNAIMDDEGHVSLVQDKNHRDLGPPGLGGDD